ncbi:MAG: phosphate signaling complex protein PhoU [Planctomycetota bacterium]
MSEHFEQELTRLRRDFSAHAALCFEALERARETLRDRDTALAQRVVDGDDRVDRQEVAIEAEVVRLITLYHPVAHDMRLLITLLKLNHDLERTADHAANVAWLGSRIVRRGGRIPQHLLDLAERVVGNSRQVFQAFLDQDLEAARAVVRRDADVDALDRTVRHEVADMLGERGEIGSALHVFRISRELERVGDLVCNMAEDVIWLITGENVRHRELPPAPAETGRGSPGRGG